MDWSEDFETGLADIDVQHRVIFALAQRIEELEERGDTDALLEVAIVEAFRFARAHFGCEEQLMLAYDYAGIAQHRAEHASLLQEIAALVERQDANPREIILFTCKWLMSHSLLEDRCLAQHILKTRAEALGLTVQQLSALVSTSGTQSATYQIPPGTDVEGSRE